QSSALRRARQGAGHPRARAAACTVQTAALQQRAHEGSARLSAALRPANRTRPLIRRHTPPPTATRHGTRNTGHGTKHTGHGTKHTHGAGGFRRMRIAYLTGEYPRATDTFVQREVAALREL